jgi:hypothetical protein
MRWLLPLLALCLGAPATAAEKKLTLVVTGDNGGEIAPCG